MDEDFNIPSEERKVLLEQLQEAMGDVPLHFWAACHLCDLKALEKFVKIACISPGMVHYFADGAKTMIYYWTQSQKGSSRQTSGNSSPASASTGGTPGSTAANTLNRKQKPLPRSQTAKALAKERDGYQCVLTGQSANLHVVHIYPFFDLKDSETTKFGQRHTFWKLLDLFWPSDKIAIWKQELFPEGITKPGIEKVDNLLTLHIGAHSAWNIGAFALKPLSVSDNGTILKIQFFWQKHQLDVQEETSLLNTPHSTQGLIYNQGEHGQKTVLHHLFDTIESGHIFEITTNDPQKKPLPSFQLLELQWFLTRISGMAGAGNPPDVWTYDWDDSDDLVKIPSLDLDETGNSSFASDPSPPSPESLRQS